MGRINYIYKNKYALTLTARKDGFSGFAENSKYATFPSVAFAWTASNEKFIEKYAWLENLKIRISYGKNGNQAIGRLSSTFAERFNLHDVPYWRPNRPSNKYSRIDYSPNLPTLVLEDRSFIRLQDVSISYTFDEDVLGDFNRLKLYVSAKNLYTLTKWTGYDPENATVMRGGFPLMKSFTVGIDLKF